MNKTEQANALLEAQWILDGKTLRIPTIKHLRAMQAALNECQLRTQRLQAALDLERKQKASTTE